MEWLSDRSASLGTQASFILAGSLVDLVFIIAIGFDGMEWVEWFPVLLGW
jgi:hypothetical protein